MKQKTFRRTAAMISTLMLLGACGTQAAGGTQPAAPAVPGIAVVAQSPVPKASYTEVALPVEGLAVEPGEAYYLPLGEGKYIPADDAVWLDYLDGQELSALEGLSMPFVAVGKGQTALVYVMTNPYRAGVRFARTPQLALTLVGEVSPLEPAAINTVRVYTTQNSAVAVAAAYRAYREEMGEVLTLADKAAQNPQVKKLYGAPHIYLWGDFLLSAQDVNWQALRKAASSPALAALSKALAGTENGTAFADVLGKVAGQDYVDKYQQSVLLRGISQALSQPDLYGAADKNPAVQLQQNKRTLCQTLPGVFAPAEDWYNDATVDILDEMKNLGIDTAWIGLNNWEQAYQKPQLAQAAVKHGYLMGPYDSYHSIHAPGKEQWNTAAFPDATLYENATVQNQKGEKIGGFQNVGRKLNPTLAMPSVRRRIQEILSTGASFNSWFVDCDATGEVYDDHSSAHPTTKQQDVAARLERLDYLAKEQKMVVGSEGGNDFAGNSIAFAHGIELQTFSWMDADMKGNKDSEYYLGRYYSASGGVPEKFAKPVPVKEKYRALFLEMSYQVPLYKLVYNNSVITAAHWDWSTFKISGEVENRMLREVLYNVPPMYHLDRTEWDRYKTAIAAHNAVWSPFSQKAITQPMTDFGWLTDDRLVQTTRYGADLQAVANFSGEVYTHNGTAIPPRSVLILDGKESRIYTPSV